MRSQIDWFQSVLGGARATRYSGFCSDHGDCPIVLLQALQVSHNLPTLGLGQPRPRRHAVLQAAVGEKPLEFTSSRVADAIRMQIRTLLFAHSFIAVAGRAVLPEEFSAGGNSFGIGIKRALLLPLLVRHL